VAVGDWEMVGELRQGKGELFVNPVRVERDRRWGLCGDQTPATIELGPWPCFGQNLAGLISRGATGS
jgi:hypothetical protein